MEKETLKSIVRKQGELANHRLSRRSVSRELDITAELSNSEISIITGVRRSGKSMYLSQLKKRLEEHLAILSIEFDDPALEGFSGSDFQLLSDLCDELHPGAARRLYLLDEIQNVPGWERWLPQLAKDPTIKIVATGSNAKILSSELSTLLTGRHRSHEMTPLSLREIVAFDYPSIPLGNLSIEQLASSYERYFIYGGFPRALCETDASILPQYFVDIVERDVIARHGARLTRPLRELSRVLCSDNTRLLNRTNLAKQLGIKDAATIKRYCDWMEESYLFYEVKRFSPSVRKQMRSNAKYYCVDPTLARYSAFSLSEGRGAFLENIVYLELRRRGYDIHYWTSEDSNSEVDFVARKAGQNPLAVQVSLTTIDESTLERELRSLMAFHNQTGSRELLLITKEDPAQSISLGEVKVASVPFLTWAFDLS